VVIWHFGMFGPRKVWQPCQRVRRTILYVIEVALLAETKRRVSKQIAFFSLFITLPFRPGKKCAESPVSWTKTLDTFGAGKECVTSRPVMRCAAPISFRIARFFSKQYTKILLNHQNGHKIYQMVVIYSK
jgi:hypothetical protein